MWDREWGVVNSHQLYPMLSHHPTHLFMSINCIMVFVWDYFTLFKILKKKADSAALERELHGDTVEEEEEEEPVASTEQAKEKKEKAKKKPSAVEQEKERAALVLEGLAEVLDEVKQVRMRFIDMC